jgi:hypothetical protein
MSLEWIKQPLTRAIARSIRSGTRVSRPTLDGHRFIYDDLKQMWADSSAHHVVLTHDKDPIWQYWRYSPEGGWEFKDTAETLEDIQQIAGLEVVDEVETRAAGTYVVAQKDGSTLRVHCTSREGPEAISAIWKRMGYAVSLEEVS